MSLRLNEVVFDAEDGAWAGAVPVYRQIALEMLTRRDLEELLDRAIGRG